MVGECRWWVPVAVVECVRACAGVRVCACGCVGVGRACVWVCVFVRVGVFVAFVGGGVVVVMVVCVVVGGWVVGGRFGRGRCAFK